MAQFKNISQAQKKALTVDKFGGVDLTNSQAKISFSRSPNAVNMIRDSLGKVKKRFGYKKIYSFEDCIFGIFYFIKGSQRKMVIHSGSKLYIESEDGYEVIFENLNEKNSQGVQFGNKLVIADGKKLIYYDGEKAGYIEDIAYQPTLVTGRSNTGGGTFLDSANILSTVRTESYKCDGYMKTFQLASQNIKSIKSIKFNFNNLGWRDYLEEGHPYWLNTNKSTLELDFAITAAVGEDNCVITYEVERNEDNFNTINTASFLTLYGAYGAMDRLFVGGNSTYANRDYYSELNDPTYFPDTNYGVFGSEESPIVGYSLVSDNLCVHKTNELSNANMILRYGTVDDEGNATFKITGTCVGDGAVSKEAFAHLDSEPAYLTPNGICAITPSDIMGERFSQLRSYYLNGKLLNEDSFSKASAVTYKSFFMLLVGEKIYILDSMNPSTEERNLYSHRQYEGYIWDNIPANILFSDGEKLMFGGKNGELCVFYDNEEDENCYLDDGKPVEAYWQFPKFLGDDYSKKKTIMHFSVLFDDYSKNTKIQYKNITGEWQDVAFKNSNRMFVSKRLHIKNSEDAEIRIINSENEALKINTVKISYINNGKIK